MEEEEIEPVIFSMPKFPRKEKEEIIITIIITYCLTRRKWQLQYVQYGILCTMENSAAKNKMTKVLYRINVSGNRWCR